MYSYDNVLSVVLVSSSAVEVRVDNGNNNCSRLLCFRHDKVSNDS